MSKWSRRKKNLDTPGLMITPMIDMFTVILIFLIVHYAPEHARIKKSEGIKLPKSTLDMAKVPHVQIEVAPDYISLNGERVEGLNPTSSNWKVFSEKLKALSKSDEPVLIMADKDTSYRLVDLTVAHLAVAGFSEVYFLTEKEEKKQ